MSNLILALDAAGTPHRWIDYERAAYYYSKELVLWAAGTSEVVLTGGTSRITGCRSKLAMSTIIAIKGNDFMVRHYSRVPAVNKSMLFARDRHTCAYCGEVFKPTDLEIEHVHPRSRGGAFNWTNLVTACRLCNDKKADKTPEEAGMPLLFVPYVPNRHEAFILNNRKILADQMEFLMLGVPKTSRLYS